MKTYFYHIINKDPEPEDVGKVKITTTIFGDDNLKFSTSTLVQEFIMNNNDDCESKKGLNSFLIETGFNNNVISDTLLKLVSYVEDVTLPGNDDYLLEVIMDLESDLRDYNDSDYDDDRIDIDDDDDDVDDDYDDNNDDDEDDEDENGLEEAIQQLSFDESNDNIIKLRPASKFIVNCLPRNVYEYIGFNGKTCSICRKKFEDEQIVVSLPCGHDFDEECIVNWFETSHVCPLCRFRLPFEDR